VFLKLAGLFAISFALFFMMFFGYEVLSGIADRSAASMRPEEETKAPIVDPKIAQELADVLATDNSRSTQAVKDPFSDRGGLSGRFEAATASASNPSQNHVVSSPASAGATGGRTSSGGGGFTTIGSSPNAVPVDGTKQRYDTWLARLGIAGDTPLDPRIFSIADLWPVGIVDGGSGQQEVMFFSQSTGKTVSFPVGTMFYDGWLAELRPEGVVFSSNDNRKIVTMRSWSRSVRPAG
jgi:hypothetical protein